MGTPGELMSTLTESLHSALNSLPETTTLQPPPDGISLFDTKNELLLSYLQNLVFLIILKLRNRSSPDTSLDVSSDDEVVKTLVSLRTYLEKGVRPLESRLKYQLDKLLFAAAEDSTVTTAQLPTPDLTSKSHQTNGDTSDPASDSAAPGNPHIPDLAHRPNPSSLLPPRKHSSAPYSSSIYQPPRFNPTAPPSIHQKLPPKSRKSHLLDSFVREELTDAPLAEPSIGSGGGLKGKERENDEERRGYEEQRLVRLPEEKRKRRRGGEGFGEDDLLGGIGGVDFGGAKGRKRGRMEGREERVGEAWKRRAGRGVGRKRR